MMCTIHYYEPAIGEICLTHQSCSCCCGGHGLWTMRRSQCPLFFYLMRNNVPFQNGILKFSLITWCKLFHPCSNVQLQILSRKCTGSVLLQMTFSAKGKSKSLPVNLMWWSVNHLKPVSHQIWWDTPPLKAQRLHIGEELMKSQDTATLISNQTASHKSLQVEEAGLVVKPKYTRTGARPVGLVYCRCCPPAVY